MLLHWARIFHSAGLFLLLEEKLQMATKTFWKEIPLERKRSVFLAVGLLHLDQDFAKFKVCLCIAMEDASGSPVSTASTTGRCMPAGCIPEGSG